MPESSTRQMFETNTSPLKVWNVRQASRAQLDEEECWFAGRDLGAEPLSGRVCGGVENHPGQHAVTPSKK